MDNVPGDLHSTNQHSEDDYTLGIFGSLDLLSKEGVGDMSVERGEPPKRPRQKSNVFRRGFNQITVVIRANGGILNSLI